MDWINECWMFSPSKLKKDIPHKDFTLSSLIFSTYTTCVSLPYHIAGHATLQLYSRQSTRQININNICKNSLAKKKSLTGCHELLGKVFMARVGMITLVPEMRQNTGTDVRKAHHRLPARHTIHFCRTYYSLDNLLISLQVPYMHESRKKVMLSNWSTRKDD